MFEIIENFLNVIRASEFKKFQQGLKQNDIDFVI